LTETTEILLVDDDKSTCELLKDTLESADYKVSVASSGSEAMEKLQEKYFPVIVSDIQLGSSNGLELLTYINTLDRPSAVILITGFGSLDTAVQAVQHRAFDYISKPTNLVDVTDELLSKVARAVRHLETLRKSLVADTYYSTASVTMIGKSAPMVDVYKVVAKAAISKSTVLIIGDSGTGKELVAKAIHENSERVQNPFVTVNCCAIVETLLESELFGHAKGSFTGAIANKRGLFEEAHGGTLFLDEIGDISHTMQVKLLRVLQEGEIKPVGASIGRTVDVRVIAATHRDLDALVKEGKFREDLYYRLKVLSIHVPSLKKRKEDIPDLVKFFLAKSNQKTGRQIVAVSEEAMSFLCEYPWPGNIRELENTMERAVALTNTNVLYPEDFPPEIQVAKATESADEEQERGSKQLGRSQTQSQVGIRTHSLEELEKIHIIKTLNETNFNKSRTAEILGIDRVTLYRKAHRYGISLNHRKSENDKKFVNA
jgi:DNA-binding NtrC family response regulator